MENDVEVFVLRHLTAHILCIEAYQKNCNVTQNNSENFQNLLKPDYSAGKIPVDNYADNSWNSILVHTCS